MEEIEARCTVHGERLRTLLSACVALKLIRRRYEPPPGGQEMFWLPKASTDQLVRSSKRYWGDYISGQVGAQFYSRMTDLLETLESGSSSSHGYETWFESDPQAAERYTKAQHNGSLATARAMLKRLPELVERGEQQQQLGSLLRMLDVGGGSGAFSIATARKIPNASCVVLDLPNVVSVAQGIIEQEPDASVLQERISTLPLSASAPGDWYGVVEPESFDVVLMSYVSGSIPTQALLGLYRNAFQALKPGGMAILHDFFVNNHGQGPLNPALWALAHVTVNPEGMGLRPNRIVQLLCGSNDCSDNSTKGAGFIAPKVLDLVPETTQLIVVTKPTNHSSTS